MKRNLVLAGIILLAACGKDAPPPPAISAPEPAPQAAAPPVSNMNVPAGFTAVGDAADPASGLPMRIRHDGIGYELVLIPEGEFMMGSNAGNSNEKPEHRVKLSAYYIGVDEVKDDAGKPMTEVTWQDANQWAERQGMRLPTEAEWEMAARGNYGLENAVGGAWEWVSDWYDPNYYAGSPTEDPKGPSSSPDGSHVIRSGQGATGATVRAYGGADYKDKETGIRAALSLTRN